MVKRLSAKVRGERLDHNRPLCTPLDGQRRHKKPGCNGLGPVTDSIEFSLTGDGRSRQLFGRALGQRSRQYLALCIFQPRGDSNPLCLHTLTQIHWAQFPEVCSF